ncbi:unnamed protein product [Arctogadus glacialis]
MNSPQQEPLSAQTTATTTTFYFFFVSCRPSLSSSSSSLGGLKALWSVFVSVLMCFNANQKPQTTSHRELGHFAWFS